MNKEESIIFDEKSENQFEHLREVRASLKKESSQKTDRNRLPTQMMVVRDKSICISDDSHFYNKSSAHSDDNKSKKNDQMALEFMSQDEIFDAAPKEHIPGFSFFGRRDLVMKASVNSEQEIRGSCQGALKKSKVSKEGGNF